MTDLHQATLPRFTIITSTYNCAEALTKTAVSIREQSYTNIQWIVADGASIDGTVEVIKKNQDIVSKWFSEPDRGIYDAWNKACRLIDGDWILFLGAGDLIASTDVLENIANHSLTLDDSAVVIYGNVLLMKPDGTPRYISRKPTLNYFEFGRPALPHHQGVFQNRRLFSGYESFDPSYKIAGDSKFLLAATKIGTFSHADFFVGMMADDGASNNYKNILVARREIQRICFELGIAVPILDKILADINRIFHYVGNKCFPEMIIMFAQRLLDKLRAIKII